MLIITWRNSAERIEKRNEELNGLHVLDMSEDEHAVPRWSRCCTYYPCM